MNQVNDAVTFPAIGERRNSNRAYMAVRQAQ